MDVAFRFMAQGKHMGKIVVKIREEESNRPSTIPKSINVPAIPRTLCDPSLIYLIYGGLGGLGLELTNFLFKRGARKFCLTSKSGIKSAYQKRVLAKWQSKGAQILISTKNAAIKSEAEALLSECKKIGPVGGVFQLAGVLKDALFDEQTLDDFLTCSEAKYFATKNFDELCRTDAEIRKNLNWFVAFSSVACGRGNAGK